MLLVTSAELEEAWQPFAKWKTQHGKPAKIVTTANIEKNFDGSDLQEKIRLCVREHIDKHQTRWVILGGDSQPGGKGIVPDRDTVHKTQWGENTDIPTDIYFLSPTDWDGDDDGIYGEFEDDSEAITYPDGSVGLGRIPVRNAADIKAYTDKVISYESAYPEGEFGSTMVYTCTVAGAYAKVKRSWDDHVSKALPDGKMSRYFADKTPWDKDEDGDYQLNSANCTPFAPSRKVQGNGSSATTCLRNISHCVLKVLSNSSPGRTSRQSSKKSIGLSMSGFHTGVGVSSRDCTTHLRNPTVALPSVPSTCIVKSSSRRTRTHQDELN